tara:strand:- start:5163 stop:5666 length:504 start_codon:yes stop_codon:yes gene_type:complete
MSQQQFFSDDINELTDSNVYNVVCRNQQNGRYCYGFFNEKTGVLSTGYQFEENDDLDIVLDQTVWSFVQKESLDNIEQKINNSEDSTEKKEEHNIDTVNILVLKDHLPFEILSFPKTKIQEAEETFLSKIKNHVSPYFKEEEMNDFLDDGSCSLSTFSFEVYLIHSS